MTSPLTWAPLLAGLLFLGIFVVVEKRGAHPFFPIELFRNPGFVAAVGMGVAFNLAPRAVSHHAWYRDKFGDAYPSQRRALVPFLF